MDWYGIEEVGQTSGRYGLKRILTEHLHNLLILLSLGQMYISMNKKEKFLNTTKFVWALPWNALMAAGVCPIFQWKDHEVVYIGFNHANVAR